VENPNKSERAQRAERTVGRARCATAAKAPVWEVGASRARAPEEPFSSVLEVDRVSESTAPRSADAFPERTETREDLRVVGVDVERQPALMGGRAGWCSGELRLSREEPAVEELLLPARAPHRRQMRTWSGIRE